MHGTSTGSTIAALRDVTKRYGQVTALHRLDLEIRRGEVLALLGPNGAGKTTGVFGLWVPLQLLPHPLQELARIFPAYHSGEIAPSVLHQGGASRLSIHLIYLLAFTALYLWSAQRGWRRIQDR